MDHVLEFAERFDASVAPRFLPVDEQNIDGMTVDVILGHEIFIGTLVDLKDVGFIAHTLTELVNHRRHGLTARAGGIVELYESRLGLSQILLKLCFYAL